MEKAKPHLGFSTEEIQLPVRVDSPMNAGPKGSSPPSGDSCEIKDKQKPKPKPSQMTSSELRFVVAGHPNDFKDRAKMRENRIYVMNRYLDNERRQEHSRDARVNADVRTKQKRKPLESLLSAPNKEEGASQDDGVRSESPRRTAQQSVPGISHPDHETIDRATARSCTRPRSAVAQTPDLRAALRRVRQRQENPKSLVDGIGSRFEYSEYMKTSVDEVPAGPGANLEPFNTWPTLLDPSLDVRALKYSCSQHFGSYKLSAHWIPAILRVRHAFLSSLCISSAHDAIMTRALVPSHAQSTHKSIERWKIKRDVISMVARVMSDPQQQATDETIVAVLQLLNSDIMGCDDREVQIHQDGLRKIVEQRGGLEQLGLCGELAGVLTITNYLIASLREMTPHEDYVHFASKRNTRLPTASQIPESPICSRAQGFITLAKALPVKGDAYQLLDIMRSSTITFYTEHEQLPDYLETSGHNSSRGHDPLCERVFKFAPASEMDFDGMNERYTYESIRLASRVQAYSLSRGIPFSKAAVQLAKQDNLDTSIPIRLKQALMRTDLSTCWDHLAGVLFWVSIVGGAAANPGAVTQGVRFGEEEDARKFLAALAVRCCIVLSFQYGRAVLETLKRIVAIERALAGTTSQEKGDRREAWRQPGAGRKGFGPMEPSFSDFVLDLEA